MAAEWAGRGTVREDRGPDLVWAEAEEPELEAGERALAEVGPEDRAEEVRGHRACGNRLPDPAVAEEEAVPVVAQELAAQELVVRAVALAAVPAVEAEQGLAEVAVPAVALEGAAEPV